MSSSSAVADIKFGHRESKGTERTTQCASVKKGPRQTLKDNVNNVNYQSQYGLIRRRLKIALFSHLNIHEDG